MSKLLRHESSFLSPQPSNENLQGVHWLMRVLLKINTPNLCLSNVAMTQRRGRGNRDLLMTPTVSPENIARKRPASVRQRPASSSSSSGFQSVWKRRSTNVTFQ
eukprot:12430218-Karenia_brevis.AAC.1